LTVAVETTPEGISMPNLLTNLLARLRAIGDRVAPLGPLLARLTVGFVFIGTGWAKFHGIDDVTKNFTDWGIPVPAFNARLAAGTEFFGGILMILGLGTRIVALPMAFTMFVAIVKVRRAAIEDWSSLFGFEEWSYLVFFMWLALAGAGPLSIDGLRARVRRRPFA
jgi:putative oxidoreductase